LLYACKYLRVADKWEVFSKRVTLKAIVGENTSQIWVVRKVDTVQVPHLQHVHACMHVCGIQMTLVLIHCPPLGPRFQNFWICHWSWWSGVKVYVVSRSITEICTISTRNKYQAEHVNTSHTQRISRKYLAGWVVLGLCI